MKRSDHHPGRGSGSSPLALTTPVTVTAAATSQTATPTASTQGVEPEDTTITPTHTMASPANPVRRAQTAVLQCPSCRSAGGSSTSGTTHRRGSSYGSRLKGGYSSVSSRKYPLTRSAQR